MHRWWGIRALLLARNGWLVAKKGGWLGEQTCKPGDSFLACLTVQATDTITSEAQGAATTRLYSKSLAGLQPFGVLETKGHWFPALPSGDAPGKYMEEKSDHIMAVFYLQVQRPHASAYQLKWNNIRCVVYDFKLWLVGSPGAIERSHWETGCQTKLAECRAPLVWLGLFQKRRSKKVSWTLGKPLPSGGKGEEEMRDCVMEGVHTELWKQGPAICHCRMCNGEPVQRGGRKGWIQCMCHNREQDCEMLERNRTCGGKTSRIGRDFQ